MLGGNPRLFCRLNVNIIYFLSQAKSFLITGDGKQFKILEAQHQDILEKNGEGGSLLK